KAESWRESQRLESILITLNLAPCFDGETFILLSTDEYDRIIWKTFNSEIISEAFLPAGYVLKQFDLLFTDNSPDDLIPLTDEYYRELMQGQVDGKYIEHRKGGPVLVEHREYTPEELVAQAEA
ncbi:hypothetical protein SEEH8413_04308, partial [Salmonella enterica subsp. enterica serovar Heidelberg str. N18413]